MGVKHLKIASINVTGVQSTRRPLKDKQLQTKPQILPRRPQEMASNAVRSLQVFFLHLLLGDEISSPASRRTTGDAPLGGVEAGTARLGIKEAAERLPYSL
jgi:hypothetical protein